jgi:hypothetical protein
MELLNVPAPRRCALSDYHARERGSGLDPPAGGPFPVGRNTVTGLAQHVRCNNLRLAQLTHEIIVGRFASPTVLFTTREIFAARTPRGTHSADSHARKAFRSFVHHRNLGTTISSRIPPPRYARRREPPKACDSSAQVVGRFKRDFGRSRPRSFSTHVTPLAFALQHGLGLHTAASFCSFCPVKNPSQNHRRCKGADCVVLLLSWTHPLFPACFKTSLYYMSYKIAWCCRLG